jgi:hypothetical protein
MPKLKKAIIILIGFVSMVLLSWASMVAINIGYTSGVIRLLVGSCIFLVAGTLAGIIFQDMRPTIGSFFLLLPLAVVTVFSIAFSGFILSSITNDLPILVLAFLAGSLGFYTGSVLGRRMFRRQAEHPEPSKN